MERISHISHDQQLTTSVNPVTNEILGTSPLHSAEDVAAMVQQAREAQKAWAALPAKKRTIPFYNIIYYLVKHADELAETIARDTGKLRTDAMITEVFPSTMLTAYFIRKTKKFLKERSPGVGSPVFLYKRSKIRRVPYGVIGIISPWNYPFLIPFYEIIMGLLAGNAVIFKTASETQMVGLAIKKVIETAGLPEGLFHYVNMSGREAGPAFLKAGVDKLFFTGSNAVGKTLMKMAAQTLTPVNLELGGNDPMIVCEDADLERAVNGAMWAGFSNAGQSCGAVERIYVHEKIYTDFLTLLKSKVEQLRVGYDLEFNMDVGALISKSQINTVKKQINDALKKGATIYAQSQVPKNKDWANFLPVMVLTDVNHEMELMREETFGPVLGVMKFSTIEEAIALANDTHYGLSASVWSRDRKKAGEIARKIQAGAVTINDHLMSHGLPETPWGGFKQSGIGRSHGKIGFYDMTQPQVIVDDMLSSLKKQPWWHPYDEHTYRGLRGILTAVYGEGIIPRLTGLWAMIRLLAKTIQLKLE